jgi:hypothetical protein
MPSRSSADRARAVRSVTSNGVVRVSVTCRATRSATGSGAGISRKMARHASVISSTVSNRRAVSRASALAKNATSRSVTDGSNAAGSRVTSSLITAGLAPSPQRGSVPVAISYRVTAAENRSAAASNRIRRGGPRNGSR